MPAGKKRKAPHEAHDDAPRDAPAAEQNDADVEQHIGALEREVTEWKDKALRARADYDNLQKRTQDTLTAERDRVKARVLESFLQVYEYGLMAAFEAERNPGPLADGVKMVVREFDRLLQQEGVRPIGAVGEPFDAKVHEAVAEEPAADVPAGHVSRVVALGYRLGDKVLRYAKVAVAPVGDGAGSGGGSGGQGGGSGGASDDDGDGPSVGAPATDAADGDGDPE